MVLELDHYLQLKLIAWTTPHRVTIEEEAAFLLYETNWRFVDVGALTPSASGLHRVALSGSCPDPAALETPSVASRRRIEVAEVEVLDRVERRRKWSEAEKVALLAEVDASGGKVAVVARRHRISESLLYNRRAAVRAAAKGELGATTAELNTTAAELRAAKAAVQFTRLEIEKLKMQLAKLRRMQFGQSSERLNRQIEQLELQLEEVEATEALAEALAEASGQVSTRPERMKPKRRPLPEHLPRQDILLEPADACTPNHSSALVHVARRAAVSTSNVPMCSAIPAFAALRIPGVSNPENASPLAAFLLHRPTK
jgi:transposase-like protein